MPLSSIDSRFINIQIGWVHGWREPYRGGENPFTTPLEVKKVQFHLLIL